MRVCRWARRSSGAGTRPALGRQDGYVAWHDTGDAAQQEAGQQPKSEWADGLDSRDGEFAILLSEPAQGIEGAADELDVADLTECSPPAGGHVVDDRMQSMVDRVRQLAHLAVGQPAVQVAQLGFGSLVYNYMLGL